MYDDYFRHFTAGCCGRPEPAPLPPAEPVEQVEEAAPVGG